MEQENEMVTVGIKVSVITIIVNAVLAFGDIVFSFSFIT